MQPVTGWWLRQSALLRQAVPVNLAVLTNQHDHTTSDNADSAVCLPIDEVIGYTDIIRVAMDFLTVDPLKMEAWKAMFLHEEHQPSKPLRPAYLGSTNAGTNDGASLEKALDVPWPEDTNRPIR